MSISARNFCDRPGNLAEAIGHAISAGDQAEARELTPNAPLSQFAQVTGKTAPQVRCGAGHDAAGPAIAGARGGALSLGPPERSPMHQAADVLGSAGAPSRSEEHTSELQSP